MKIQKQNVTSVTTNDSHEWGILQWRRFHKAMPCKNGWNCISRENTLIPGYFINQELCCWTDWWNVGDLKQQLNAVSLRFEHFSIAIDETIGITGIVQLAIYIRACDSEFNIHEELIELVPLHDTTTIQYIFERVEQILHEYSFDLSKLVLIYWRCCAYGWQT